MQRKRSNIAHDDVLHASQQRRRIAVEAARLMSEQGVRDFHIAKLKAAERLGIGTDSALPKNSEVEEALREHQRLFDAADQPQRLQRYREAARESLVFFAAFEPRLVGAVLDGSADRHSSVCLHLFADEAEAVIRFLDENGIPFEEHDRALRLSRDDEPKSYPVFEFSAGGVPFDVTVLPPALLRQAPLDRSGDKPMRRANLAALDALLAGAE
jgi:hypothetical protein